MAASKQNESSESRDSSKLRVAVIFGGRSAEHEISLISARFIVQSLDRGRFEPVLIGIDKEGRWHLQEEAMLLGASRDPRLVRLNQAMPDVALAAHPSAQGEGMIYVGGEASTGAKRAIDVVFPVLHGPMGEDGSVQGLLELAGVPYVGSGVLGSAVGMDKDVMKRLLLQAGLPIVRHETVRRIDWEKEAPAVLSRCAGLGFPCFIKPANLGSSVGIGRVKDFSGLRDAIEHAFLFDTKIIAEQGLVAPREIECAVLGDEEPIASIPGEIVVDHPDGFYSYAAKYIDEKGATIRIPAELSDEQKARVKELSVRTFQTLEASGLARIDFFLARDGALYVNEINTIPGFTAISMYPKLWEASGVGAAELVSRLIDIALKRGERKKKLRTSA